jgi:hypothetical protein
MAETNRVTTTWGPNALPYDDRRNEDVELVDDNQVGGVVRASSEDGGVGTSILVEKIDE